MSVIDRVREDLRRRWLFRRGTAPGPRGAGGTAIGRRIGVVGWVVLSFLAFALLYYPVGMILENRIADSPDFVPPAADQVAGGSKSVEMVAGLIDREVNLNNWVANDPIFMPGYFLDNTPNFQKGMVAALARFTFELTDQIGRTRGSSQADPDLQAAAGLLQYPADVWVWNPRVSLVPRATTESQYREARERLLEYNSRLAQGDAVFDRRADNLLATLDRFAADLGSASAAVYTEVHEDAYGIFDFNADDIFYDTKGRLYGYYMILKGLEQDFADVIQEKNLHGPWDQMMETFRQAVLLSPWFITNGDPDSLAVPNHLTSQGFYLLRARTQLREVTNILQK